VSRPPAARAALWGHNPDILHALPLLLGHVGVAVRTVASAEEALALARRGRVDFLIVDCVGADDASARCRAVIGQTALPLHICHAEENFVADLRPQSPAALYWLPPAWTGLSLFEKVRTLLAEAAAAAAASAATAVEGHLTPRERDVIALVAAGRDNASIARDLHIGKETVKDYVHNLMVKYGVATRPELIVAHNARRVRVGDGGGAPAPPPREIPPRGGIVFPPAHLS